MDSVSSVLTLMSSSRFSLSRLFYSSSSWLRSLSSSYSLSRVKLYSNRFFIYY